MLENDKASTPALNGVTKIKISCIILIRFLRWLSYFKSNLGKCQQIYGLTITLDSCKGSAFGHLEGVVTTLMSKSLPHSDPPTLPDPPSHTHNRAIHHTNGASYS